MRWKAIRDISSELPSIRPIMGKGLERVLWPRQFISSSERKSRGSCSIPRKIIAMLIVSTNGLALFACSNVDLCYAVRCFKQTMGGDKLLPLPYLTGFRAGNKRLGGRTYFSRRLEMTGQL